MAEALPGWVDRRPLDDVAGEAIGHALQGSDGGGVAGFQVGGQLANDVAPADEVLGR